MLAPACDGEEATAPAPRSAPTVAGPIAVYAVGREVVVFDVGARRDVRRVRLPNDALSVAFTQQMKVAYIVWTDFGMQVHSVDPLSGTDDIISQFPAPGLGAFFLLSPDGQYAAFTAFEETEPQSPARVGVVDLRSGLPRVLATFADIHSPEFRGLPMPKAWRDDGLGFVVVGETRGHLATIMLDGGVRFHGSALGRLSPNGRAVAFDGVNMVGCVFGTQQLRIRNLDTDQDVAVVDDVGRGLVFREWSPTGNEVLYTKYETAPSGEACLPEFDPASGRAYVVSALGGPPSLVTDVRSLRERWYGGAAIEYTCASGASLEIWGSCPREPTIVELNGVRLGRQGEIRLLGVIQVGAISP